MDDPVQQALHLVKTLASDIRKATNREIKYTQAKEMIARANGFKGWPRMKRALENNPGRIDSMKLDMNSVFEIARKS